MTCTAETETPTRAAVSVGPAILALAIGGFAIGTTEFVTMGLLPQIARGVHVSIPSAGHVISAYALGVVVGAPLIAALAARLPRKGLLMGLMVAFVLGNLAASLASGYGALVAARFFSGLPHGAYFGVASLVAADLVPAGRRGRAVSRVMLGLAVANVAGVPAATWMGQHLGWRSAYVAVAALGALTVASVAVAVPRSARNPHATSRSELRAFTKAQVWLTLGAGAVGFGGMFAMYSYIAPTVLHVARLGEGYVPVYLLVFGTGMITGTAIGGRLADWSILRTLVVAFAAMAVLLALFTQTAQWLVPGILTAYGIAVSTSVVAVVLQMRLMHVAGDAATIGAALNHSALNLANALGAWLGGLVIAAGFGYTATSWVGVALAAGGLVIMLVSVRLHLRRRAVPAAAEVDPSRLVA
ncbi:MAG TPA: MFS transporter [Marmoricola sp.]|nr:MFS transporter [Marmoricola sp.]